MTIIRVVHRNKPGGILIVCAMIFLDDARWLTGLTFYIARFTPDKSIGLELIDGKHAASAKD